MKLDLGENEGSSLELNLGLLGLEGNKKITQLRTTEEGVKHMERRIILINEYEQRDRKRFSGWRRKRWTHKTM